MTSKQSYVLAYIYMHMHTCINIRTKTNIGEWNTLTGIYQRHRYLASIGVQHPQWKTYQGRDI